MFRNPKNKKSYGVTRTHLPSDWHTDLTIWKSFHTDLAYCFNTAIFGIINSIASVRNFMEVKRMSRISEDQVKHVAHLARLAITEDEAKKFTNQLDAIIGFAEQLNELDTENVEATSHVLDMKNVMRKDEPTEGLPREEVLKNAPDKKDGQVRVPSILD